MNRVDAAKTSALAIASVNSGKAQDAFKEYIAELFPGVKKYKRDQAKEMLEAFEPFDGKWFYVRPSYKGKSTGELIRDASENIEAFREAFGGEIDG
jgi:hypothetical protein